MSNSITKALSGGTNASGGFTVPDILASEVLEFITAQSVTIPDMVRVNMTSDTLLLPRFTTGTTATFIAENTTVTGGDPGFGQTTLSAKKVAALLTASSELLEDSAANIAGLITQTFARDIALKIDAEILGTSTTNFGDAIGNTGNANNLVSGGTASWQMLVSASNKILTGNFNYPDTLYCHPVLLQKLSLLTDSTARPIFNGETFGSPLLREGVIGTVMGMKVKPTTQLTTSSAIASLSQQWGWFSIRRPVQFNRFYQISLDNWIYQSNVRPAYASRYKDAYTLIHSIV